MLSHPDGRAQFAESGNGARLLRAAIARVSEGAAGAATPVPWAAQLLCWRLIGNALHRSCMRSALPLLPRILALAAEHSVAPSAPKLVGDITTALLNASSAWWVFFLNVIFHDANLFFC